MTAQRGGASAQTETVCIMPQFLIYKPTQVARLAADIFGFLFALGRIPRDLIDGMRGDRRATGLNEAATFCWEYLCNGSLYLLAPHT